MPRGSGSVPASDVRRPVLCEYQRLLFLAPAAAGAPTGPSEVAFLLLSVGPDGKKDIDPADPNIAQLVKKGNSTDPADIAQLKAKIYQFHKEQFPEKRALNDTGDIVRPGK